MLSPRIVAYVGTFLLLVGALFILHQCGVNAGVRQEARRAAPVIAGLREDVAACQADLKGARTAIAEQNAQVQAWKAQAAQREAEAVKRAALARAEAQKYRTKAERLLAAKPEGDRCGAASRLYIEAVGGAYESAAFH